MKIAIIILCGVLASGCASNAEKKVATYTEDGLSAVTAVVLKPGSIEQGVASEEAWLQTHYPGFRRCSGSVAPAKTGKEEDEIVHFAHHTEVVGDRMISVLCVVLPDGREREFYFDITACYEAQQKEWANQPPEPTAVKGPPSNQ